MRRGGVEASRGALGLLVLLASLMGGCSSEKLNAFVVGVFEPKKTPQQNLIAAFAAEDADVRREALAKVASSKEYDRDWAIKGYVAIALMDTDPQARCVAIRALARTGAPVAAETLLKLLNCREFPPAEVRPPDALTRWDAVGALADLSAAGRIPEEQRGRTEATLIDRLRADGDRNVRIAAARGLANHPSPAAVAALIATMNDESFAVVHQCEESLVQLTGCTHACDAHAWQEWQKANDDQLFANAGRTPESRQPPYRNRVEKAGYDVKQFWRWLVPGRKE